MSDLYPNRKLSKYLEYFKRRRQEDYELAERFSMDLLAKGVSELRIVSYLQYLLKIAEFANKKLDELTKDDIVKVIAHYQMLVNKGERTTSTVFELKKTLKRFYTWLGKPELVNFFTVGKPKSNLSPQDLITQEEFEKMLNACLNSRNRAFLSLLYETGARIGEIGSMRIKDVSFDEHGAVVWLPRSKTKTRKLRVVYSARYLAEWLADHPLKNNPEAPLWIKLTSKNRGKAMEYPDFRVQLNKIAERAGINKRIYHHLFRHTRATKLLQKVPEAVGEKIMGWVPGTKMTSVYIHLAEQDVERAILEMHGIKTKNDENEDLKVLKCPRCNFISPVEAKFCTRCGLPLTEEALRQVEDWEQKKAKLIEAMTNPEILQLIISMKDEIERLKKLIDSKYKEKKYDPLE